MASARPALSVKLADLDRSVLDRCPRAERET